MKFWHLAILSSIGFGCLAGEPRGPIFSFLEENDALINAGDRHYTQGLRFAYLLGEKQTPYWMHRFADWVPNLGVHPETARLGLAFGQSFFTPENISDTELIPNDRPYAGWLYIAAIGQRRGTTGFGVEAQDSLELNLGVVGPPSLADEIQTDWHAFGGFTTPRGWNNQLKTEPGLLLKLGREWKFTPTLPEDGWGIEFLPWLGVDLGNVSTQGRLGVLGRVGYNIPDDFGPPTIDSLAAQSGGHSPSTPIFGAYLFGGAEGRAVAHNIFLDGNLWQDSPSVEKEPLVAEFRFGGALTFNYVDVVMSYNIRTREFVNQTEWDRFGSFGLHIKF